MIPKEPVKITDVISTLEKKHPRLIVMVTDCCNSYYDRSSDRQSMNNSLGEIPSWAMRS